MSRFMCLAIAAAAACAGKPAPKPPTSGAATPTSQPTDGAKKSADDPCANRPDELGPFQLTKELAARRVGTGVTTVASLVTTKAAPVEVCGVGGENAYLANLVCSNDAHAYKGLADVEPSRRGNVGPGGRCGSIIDVYVVPCPEKPYEVYLDMYHCGPGEAF